MAMEEAPVAAIGEEAGKAAAAPVRELEEETVKVAEAPITEQTPEGGLWKFGIWIHKTSLNWVYVFTYQTVRYIHTLMF